MQGSKSCRKSNFPSLWLVPLLGVLCTPLQLLAQESGKATLEEVIVTAERREASIQDTAIAVSAFTGLELEKAGVMDVYQMTTQVPNMMVTTRTTNDNVFISIRGVTASGDTPTTSFHMDGAYIPRTSGRSAYFYDLERMEVLRGPQGTLWGRNSTSGNVNVISKKPDLSGFEASGEITMGNYDLVEVRGVLNIPFSENVGGRLAFIKSDHDGYVDNGPLVDRGNDADDFSIRGHLLWDISDDTSLLFTVDAYTREGVGKTTSSIGCPPGTPGAPPGGCTEQGASNPRPEFYNPLNTQGFRDNDDLNFTLNLKHAFSAWDMNYLAAYREHNRKEWYDQEATDDWNGVFFTTVESASIQQQLVFSSNFDGPFQAVVGGFWIKDEGDTERTIWNPIIRNNISPSTGQPIGLDRLIITRNEYDVIDESAAIFLDGTYQLSDKWTLSGGIRYTVDNAKTGGIIDPDNPTAGSYSVTTCCKDSDVDIDLFGPAADIGDETWKETTWRVALDYAFNEDMMAYGSYSTGYKAGGFNAGTNDSTRNTNPNLSYNIPYNPEYIDAIELGFKGQFLDNRAQFNLTAFDYNYTDMQQFVVAISPDGVNNLTATFNVGKTTIRGVEMESTLLFGDSGRASLVVGYLDAVFDELSGVDNPMTLGQDNADLSGNTPINAPDWNLTFKLEPVVWNVFNGTLAPRLQFHYESDAWVQVQNDPGTDKRPEFTRTDLSLRYESDNEKFYIEGWVRNLENDPERIWGLCRYNVVGAFGNPNVAGIPSTADCRAMYGQPRIYGVTFGFRI